MATIEVTGAEEVAWDLTDLYAGADDPALEQDISETETAAAAFRERYHGKVAELDAAALAEAIAERERIDEIVTRAAYFAHLNFSTNMADSARGALVARLTEKDAAVDTELLFFTLELAEIDDEHGGGAARRAGARRLAPLAAVAVEVPAVPPHRAGRADPDREVRLGRLGVVAALRGAARVAPRCRSTGRSSRSRRRWRSSTTPSATCGAPRPRRSPRRSSPACARARPSTTRSCSTSRSTTGCAATRPGSRPATSPTRRPTTRCRRSSTPPSPATTSRSATTASRRAARARPALALRPLRAGGEGHEQDAVGRGAIARRRGVRRLRAGGRRHRRAVLRGELDRRAGPPRQAARRLLRDRRPGRPPVRAHELHGRPPLDPDAGARARARAARRARAAARALQRVDAAHDGGDGLGVRRGAHVQAARSPPRTTRAAGSTCSPGGSRTRSRPCSGRSR